MQSPSDNFVKSPAENDDIGDEAVENDDNDIAAQEAFYRKLEGLDAEEVLQIGYQYRNVSYNKEYFNEAILCFNHVIKLDPNNLEAYYERAVLLAKVGYEQDAFNGYSHIIKLDPNNFEAYYDRAMLYQKSGQRQEAINDLTRVIDIKFDYIDAADLKIRLLIELGQYELAEAESKKALKRESAAAKNTEISFASLLGNVLPSPVIGNKSGKRVLSVSSSETTSCAKKQNKELRI